MSEWNKFNAELNRRNKHARQFELSPEEEEAELGRRAKEAQNYVNASWRKNRENEWAAKSPEERLRIRKEEYQDNFFITTIDGKVYLQSGVDGALTDHNGTFIGYPSGEGIDYRETPDTDDLWEQNEYGQIITFPLMALEDDIRQFEEEHPDMEWGEPRLSEDVQQKINAARREKDAAEAASREKKRRHAPKAKKAPKKITLPNFNNNDGYNEELEGLTSEEWVKAGKIAANELRRRQLLRMRSKSASRVSNRPQVSEGSIRNALGEVPLRPPTRKRSKSIGGTRRKRKGGASRKISA